MSCCSFSAVGKHMRVGIKKETAQPGKTWDGRQGSFKGHTVTWWPTGLHISGFIMPVAVRSLVISSLGCMEFREE